MLSKYSYHGCLKQLHQPPDPKALETVRQINFPGKSLKNWKCTDDPGEKEWQQAVTQAKLSANGLTLKGSFTEIRALDNLKTSTAVYWAPLSASEKKNDHFPLDCLQYPLVEITYRGLTRHARLACQWSYPGGARLVHLETSADWRTAVLMIPLRNFPRKITGFTLRVYATTRSVEAVEISHIRFRELLPTERETLDFHFSTLSEVSPPRSYPQLDEQLPFGVSMDADTVSRLASMMNINYFDYWRLAFEDIARHHHDCVIVEGMDVMTGENRSILVDLAESFGLRLIPTFRWALEEFPEKGDEWIEEYIKPHASSAGIFAWNIHDNPEEHYFKNYLSARDKIAEVDTRHPVIFHSRQADTFPLYAPYFAAAGFSHFKPGDPHSVKDSICAHLPLMSGQQLWITAPAFVRASGAPEWCTSPELRLMLNMTLANGARGWMAHCYHNSPVWLNGHYQRSLTGAFLTFSNLWSELGTRIERLSVMAPLFLYARPMKGEELFEVKVSASKSAKSTLKEEEEALSVFWLEGPDYYLCHLINNDVRHVTSVDLSFPDSFPNNMEMYDTTALVRIRSWAPTPRQLHLEMSPGQGQLFLIAKTPVCLHWREVIARRILLADQRQTKVDLELARQYELDVESIENTLRERDEEMSLEELHSARKAKATLFNMIYATPAIYEPRQLLVKASSIIRSCDEALCSLHGHENIKKVRRLGPRVIPLARILTDLRLRLRRGYGSEIQGEAEKLVQESLELLRMIWHSQSS
ncbi:MAG: hypothetical protein GX130_07230 [Candidatus Hydrogenedens sp.]|nr:hypothetical protein [Candidatus Hydrogenedens sp.]